MAISYLDNNATTPLDPAVVEAMLPFLSSQYFNPSSMYEPARAVASALEQSRQSIARFLGAAHADELLFTSCATESNSTAILGVAHAQPSRRHIITTSVEHPAVLELCKDLQRQGYELDFLPVDRQGRLKTADFVRALRPDTLLVSIMHANNETGVVFPIRELARITKETDPSILFHTDATQTAGKLKLDLRGELRDVDLLSFSGHKLHAPKGIGALYIRRGTRLRPLLIGGHQEAGRRAGTENVAFIVALAKACELASVSDEERVRRMRDRLEAALLERIPNVEVNGREAERLPNTLNISCHYIEGEGILYQLSDAEICASSGSACTSGSLEPSHVLRAMQVPFTAVHGSIRFSLSRFNTDDDVDKVIQVMPEVVANLRKLSPYWDVNANRPREDAPSV